MTPAGFPHSEISGSTPACDSPELFAANHVLHRLLTPRHSPCALSSLTTNFLWASEQALVLLRSDPRIISWPSPPKFRDSPSTEVEIEVQLMNLTSIQLTLSRFLKTRFRVV